MRVLILGSGGREHALAWKIAQSSLLSQLFIAPGNAGTKEVGVNVNISYNDFADIGELALAEKIDLIVVGPEEPLVNGIVDYFRQNIHLKNISIFGPDKAAAQLEGSKSFAKKFMQQYTIPTAAHITITEEDIRQGIDFLNLQNPPYVLKADGLAAGKGVLLLDNLEMAVVSLKEMLQGKFGQASRKVVIEEYLQGIELSVFAVVDGKDYKIIGSAKDYKRIGEGDTGLNTGGMGAVSPVPFADNNFMQKVEKQIIKPTVEGLSENNIHYRGFIFFGLMNVNGLPKVIEYNVRLGDPETEVLIPRMKSDLLEILLAAKHGELANTKLFTNPKTAATVMLVSKGYPQSYEKGKPINIPQIKDDCQIFHAGTREEKNQIYTDGGRVIAVTGFGETLEDALRKAYKTVEIIDFDGKFYRTDIGFDLY